MLEHCRSTLETRRPFLGGLALSCLSTAVLLLKHAALSLVYSWLAELDLSGNAVAGGGLVADLGTAAARAAGGGMAMLAAAEQGTGGGVKLLAAKADAADRAASPGAGDRAGSPSAGRVAGRQPPPAGGQTVAGQQLARPGSGASGTGKTIAVDGCVPTAFRLLRHLPFLCGSSGQEAGPSARDQLRKRVQEHEAVEYDEDGARMTARLGTALDGIAALGGVVRRRVLPRTRAAFATETLCLCLVLPRLCRG